MDGLQPVRYYEFNSFRLDTFNRCLLRGGQTLPLQQKSYDVLLLLVQNHGRVVTKDEFSDQAWVEVNVGEEALRWHIKQLRTVLGDDPKNPHFIKTIPKKGYCFIAEVTELPDDNSPPPEIASGPLPLPEEEGRDQEPREQPQPATGVRAPQQSPPAPVARSVRRPILIVTTLIFLAVVVPLALNWIMRRGKSGDSDMAIQSIAVLPFKPVGANAGDESLEMGMAETLITKLNSLSSSARGRRIVVRPFSAVRRYNRPEQDPIEAGREIGVDAVLDGSIQKAGEKIRITARLISVRDGAQLWAGNFDETFESIFAAQDSISEQVAQALMLTLTGEESKSLAKRHTESSEAYLLYLKGRYCWNKRTEEDLRRGIEYFEQAIARDANYALAYAGLADSYLLLGAIGYSGLPPHEVFPRAERAAKKALEIDETLAEAHTSLAYIKWFFNWDWAGAEREYKRAIALNPNYATAHQWYGFCLATMGRHDEAIAEMRQAQELDPLSLSINTAVGMSLYYARRYDEAIEAHQETLKLDPDYYPAHLNSGLALTAKGKFSEAIAAYQRAYPQSKPLSDYPIVMAFLGHTYAASGNRGEALKALQELQSLAAQKHVSPYCIAVIYVGLGEKEQAFAWLEKTYEEHSGHITDLKVDPLFDPLRPDPRFDDLLRRIGILE
ncbi:MAG TPA: tetratricopeptide repeat protein [Blastocatellia bacterium]|nr:tetratricopeptide repeat protein [Blastocatellia bacterium]